MPKKKKNALASKSLRDLILEQRADQIADRERSGKRANVKTRTCWTTKVR